MPAQLDFSHISNNYMSFNRTTCLSGHDRTVATKIFGFHAIRLWTPITKIAELNLVDYYV